MKRRDYVYINGNRVTRGELATAAREIMAVQPEYEPGDVVRLRGSNLIGLVLGGYVKEQIESTYSRTPENSLRVTTGLQSHRWRKDNVSYVGRLSDIGSGQSLPATLLPSNATDTESLKSAAAEAEAESVVWGTSAGKGETEGPSKEPLKKRILLDYDRYVSPLPKKGPSQW